MLVQVVEVDIVDLGNVEYGFVFFYIVLLLLFFEVVVFGLQVDDCVLFQLVVMVVLVVVVVYKVGEVGVGMEGNFLQGFIGYVQYVLYIVVGKDLIGYDYVRGIGFIVIQLWYIGIIVCDNIGGGYMIVVVQFIMFNNIDKFVGVGCVGGVICLFEFFCLGFIVGGIQLEKKFIVELFVWVVQEFGVCLVIGIGVFIVVEVGFDQFFLVIDIIVFFVVCLAILVIVIFNVKVVVGMLGQVVCICIRFQEFLCQFDVCWDVGLFYFQDSNFFEVFQVFLMCIFLCLQVKGQVQGEEEKK